MGVLCPKVRCTDFNSRTTIYRHLCHRSVSIACSQPFDQSQHSTSPIVKYLHTVSHTRQVNNVPHVIVEGIVNNRTVDHISKIELKFRRNKLIDPSLGIRRNRECVYSSTFKYNCQHGLCLFLFCFLHKIL